LRILHIVLSRGFAGSERSTSESCNEQCKQHEVCLVVRRDHRNAEGISIVDHIDPRVRIIEVPRLFFTGRRLANAVKQFRPDVIHCHLRRSTRLIAQLHPDCATVSTLHIGVNGPHFARMDGLICNARWQLRDVPAGYAGLVHKANNSLVPHRRLTGDERIALRAGLGVAPDELLVGGVGRLSPVKGWDTLIRAVKQHRELSRMRLMIFGSGSAEASLKALAAGDAQISLPGFRKDVKDLYQAFDVFVCPSRFEPLPRVMLEAMDAGTPVIASDADGCRELIEDYGGDLFAIDDEAALGGLLADHLARPRPRTTIDLSAHHVSQANAANVEFYRRVIAARLAAKTRP
jgi:glycosyltransferase involved in cell wall biosynthesis